MAIQVVENSKFDLSFSQLRAQIGDDFEIETISPGSATRRVSKPLKLILISGDLSGLKFDSCQDFA